MYLFLLYLKINYICRLHYIIVYVFSTEYKAEVIPTLQYSDIYIHYVVCTFVNNRLGFIYIINTLHIEIYTHAI